MILRNPEEALLYAPDTTNGSDENKYPDLDPILRKHVELSADQGTNRIVAESYRKILQTIRTTRTEKVRRQSVELEVLSGNFDQIVHAKRLTPEMAKVIAEGFCGFLAMPELKTLSPEAAQELAKGTYVLVDLSGLEKVDDETLHILSRMRCNSLMLNGIRSLHVAQANILGQFPQTLCLEGIQDLDTDVLRELLQTDTVSAGALKQIHRKSSEELTDVGDNERVPLSKIAAYDEKFAAEVRAYIRILEYERRNPIITNSDGEIVRQEEDGSIARKEGEGRRLSMMELLEFFPKNLFPRVYRALKKLQENAASEYENKKKSVDKNFEMKKAEIDDFDFKLTVAEFREKFPKQSARMDAIEEILPHSNKLLFRSLGTLFPDTVSVINAYVDRIDVNERIEHALVPDSVPTMSYKKADRDRGFLTLAAQGDVSGVSDIAHIPPEVAPQIMDLFKNSVDLSLPITTLEPGTAEVFIKHPYNPEKPGVLRFDNLEDLNYRSLQILAQYPGKVYLANNIDLKEHLPLWIAIAKRQLDVIPKLTELVPVVAKKLAKIHPDELDFQNLRELSSATAAELCTYTGVLKFDALTEFKTGVATAFGLCQAQELHLNSVTDITPNKLQKLAGYKGVLRLGKITEMDVVFQDVLGTFQAREIFMPRLQHLTELAAESLCEDYKGTIHLTGLRTYDSGAKKYMRRMLKSGNIVLTEQVKDELKNIF